MTRTLAIHSHSGGTGKSTFAANLATETGNVDWSAEGAQDWAADGAADQATSSWE